MAQRDLGLLASEGALTVPLEDASTAGVLAVHTNFFEFVPEAHLGEPAPPVLLAHQLEDGGRYGIVLTGDNGLYRYDLNDVVEVRGYHNRTPKVAFLRKGGDMASITGEKLHLDQVEAALREATRRSRVELHRFRLVPVVDECRYDLLVEPEAPADDAHGAHLLAAFDVALGDQNMEYRSKRASRRLQPPRLFLMRRGWSERIWRADVAAGRRDAQYKWCSICPDWDPVSRTAVESCLRLPEDVGARSRS